LSKEQNNALRKMIERGKDRKAGGAVPRPPPTCYTCGEVGHISPQCPKKATTGMVRLEKSSGIDSLTEVSKMWTDEQVRLFAKQVYAQTEEKDRKGQRETGQD
jgi:hypothetical protein